MRLAQVHQILRSARSANLGTSGMRSWVYVEIAMTILNLRSVSSVVDMRINVLNVLKVSDYQ